MKEIYYSKIAHLLGIQEIQVKNTLGLFEQGATVPFISRYRKEATGSLDEVQIGEIKRLLEKLIEIDDRRQTIIKSIDEQGKLSDELRNKIESCEILSELEDIYLPFKPKRKTKASIARAKGLEPLATDMLTNKNIDIEKEAEKFLNEEVKTIEEALQGARDIVAEVINEDIKARNTIRFQFEREAIVKSKVIKGKEEEGVKYKDYFDFSEPLKKSAAHRLLALQRGANEGILKVSIEPDEENAIQKLAKIYFKPKNKNQHHLDIAIKDSYKRLLQPSIETEFSNLAKEKADKESINVFTQNLRQLLLSPPLGQKRILALDPGFRTGCKTVCLDEQGNLLYNETIYPHSSPKDAITAAKKLENLVSVYKIDAIAIGNGTASRETETFVKKVRFNNEVKVFIVSEAGASIYSASQAGRDEFPDFDVTVRGAISIGRRLADPLAELVKIDPKSIGIGQYQHDVDQNKLKKSLDEVVESCVNLVGVELNTASKHLLTYISGLGPQLAQNIVDYRKENGAFASREQLRNVKRMGEKTFEQAAGFLRVHNAQNPLDNSAVHPESYYIVEKMAKDLKCQVGDIIKNEELRKKIDINNYVDTKIGIPTLQDIMKELAKPGRDPREEIKILEFAEGINTINDLKEEMIVNGIVTNVTNFGAFVDIGIKENGLIHISQIKPQANQDPINLIKLHQHVRVKVTSIDKERKRIQLSMLGIEQ